MLKSHLTRLSIVITAKEVGTRLIGVTLTLNKVFSILNTREHFNRYSDVWLKRNPTTAVGKETKWTRLLLSLA